MPTLIITVDSECCRCSAKMQKILCSIQDRGEFAVEKIVYEKDKVLVSGPFDAEKLYCKLWCKAGKVIKGIEVAKPPETKQPDKPKTKQPDEPKSSLPWYKLVPYPYPYSPAWPCSCSGPHCECHSKPPAVAKPPACQCPAPWQSCHCCSYSPYQPPLPAQSYPPVLVCEDSPPYGACAVM